jgi:glucose-1-phosphate thymidylyltransferase
MMSLTAILLAGGYATRLYPLTKDTPKALLPLGQGVILDAVVNSLESVPGITQRLLVTNHRFAVQFRAWQRLRTQAIQIVDDGTDTVEKRMGAIRDLELARTQGGGRGDVLVVGTDNLFTWSLGDFVAAAQRHRPDPSIALWEAPSTEAATQCGVVTRDQTSRITSFVEKSPQAPSREVALCVYYFPEAVCAKIQEFLDSSGNADAPGYFIQWLARRGAVYGLMMRGAWYDIGTPEAYQTVVNEWHHH